MAINNSNENVSTEVHFSVGAFLLNFIYFYFKGYWIAGILLETMCLVIPFKMYFFFGLLLGFFTDNSKPMNLGKVKGTLVALLGLVSFLVLKLLMVWYLR